MTSLTTPTITVCFVSLRVNLSKGGKVEKVSTQRGFVGLILIIVQYAFFIALEASSQNPTGSSVEFSLDFLELTVIKTVWQSITEV